MQNARGYASRNQLEGQWLKGKDAGPSAAQRALHGHQRLENKAASCWRLCICSMRTWLLKPFLDPKVENLQRARLMNSSLRHTLQFEELLSECSRAVADSEQL
eukprot:TRINITY_DN2690_c0_g1_i1.p1 TRINITY_DN2690_c0_g1~~TRINITY_DN2690_c0_g1_i1.p1  ORF type:complete len:103 (-),score=11.06 TRINITY_DN2690_c0_g1_i1:358-666(-)